MRADSSPVTPRRALAALAAVGTFALGGCDRIASADQEAAEAPVVGAPEADSVPAADVAEPLPERIYFDLTRYEWYAHGEPLVHADVRYEVGGDLLAASASAMRKLGEYQGVDFYGPADSSSDSTVYVPVFPGYWLPFVRADGASANGG